MVVFGVVGGRLSTAAKRLAGNAAGPSRQPDEVALVPALASHVWANV